MMQIWEIRTRHGTLDRLSGQPHLSQRNGWFYTVVFRVFLAPSTQQESARLKRGLAGNQSSISNSKDLELIFRNIAPSLQTFPESPCNLSDVTMDSRPSETSDVAAGSAPVTLTATKTSQKPVPYSVARIEAAIAVFRQDII